ncbi:2Fe-2S iron-sulfur cluster-binding protein [Altericista sp. CCNU0014]|uniref:2Fe-2S iron-sulfur cluster-binding protein n=1 Tax=Altericista sp. CCNU0014 TaxID=3082949 RepID=UPI00384CCC28
MLESLGRIQNPLVRGLTAAATVGSIVTFASAIAIGVTNPKDKAAYQWGVYAALLATGGGAALGLAYKGKVEQRSPQSASTLSIPNAATQDWKDWRNFVVVRKVKESEEITSFYLKPEDGNEIPGFQPGQFLTIKLEIPGQAKPVLRTYSLSDYPEPCDTYRLSIKREPAPRDLDVPPGLSSNFMHDRVQEGSVISAKPPSGKFVLDVRKSSPAVLVSNGVGITPTIAMAKACSRLNPNRPIWFLHGARDGRYHAFRDEVLHLAEQNPNLQVHFAYSRPRPEDEGQFHSTGYVDTALIQSLASQDAEFFLCGSPPFMNAIRKGLQEWGVPDVRVYFESFMKARTAPAVSVSPAPALDERAEIVFAKSDRTLPWESEHDSILEFAEANDLNPDYSCRAGICGTCMCRILEGEVEYQEEPTAAIAEGSVLICISKPKTSRVVLEL